LPPLLFHAGSTEVLLDDSVRAQDRASQAGVHAEIEVWRDLPHVFQVFSWLPESKAAMRKIAGFIATRAVRTGVHAVAAPAMSPVIEPVRLAGAEGA
jgi:acetyl esterase/lipase